MISIFSIVTTVLPLLVGNICCYIFVEYGYQVTINCIEMTILEILMLALMIYEKLKVLKLNTAAVKSDTPYFKVDPKLLES